MQLIPTNLFQIVQGANPNNPIDVLFINSPIQEYTHDFNQSYQTVAPLGLGILATICKNGGLNVGVIDAEAQHLSFNTLTTIVRHLKPSVCGINLSTPNATLTYRLAQQLSPFAKIILGGAHPTLMPHLTLKECPESQVVMRGGAEQAILPVVYALKSNDGLSKIKGISFRNMNGKIVHNPDAEELPDLDELPFIDREFFSNDPYEKNGKIESAIISSKGCTFNCIFCSVPALSKRKIYFRSIQSVIHEIKILNSRYGVNSIHFMDDLFTINRKRVVDFCNELIQTGLKIQWRALSRVDTVDQELLSLMAKSGCYKLAFGIESGNPKILKIMKKNTSIQKITETIKICKEVGIETKGFFTIGYPTQTTEEIMETFNFAKKLRLDTAYFTIVRAYPGTELFETQLSRQRPESLMTYTQKIEALPESSLTNEERKKKQAISNTVPEISKSILYTVSNNTPLGIHSQKELEEMLETGIKKFYLEKQTEVDP
jgi:radical SAM superfamily enzyme YgiQ (UPF0313 family)